MQSRSSFASGPDFFQHMTVNKWPDLFVVIFEIDLLVSQIYIYFEQRNYHQSLMVVSFLIIIWILITRCN